MLITKDYVPICLVDAQASSNRLTLNSCLLKATKPDIK